jgi:hypothetical protein
MNAPINAHMNALMNAHNQGNWLLGLSDCAYPPQQCHQSSDQSALKFFFSRLGTDYDLFFIDYIIARIKAAIEYPIL